MRICHLVYEGKKTRRALFLYRANLRGKETGQGQERISTKGVTLEDNYSTPRLTPRMEASLVRIDGQYCGLNLLSPV